MEKTCTCKIPRKATTADLRKLGMGCTADLAHPYCCPVLDKARREATKRERTAARLNAAFGVVI